MSVREQLAESMEPLGLMVVSGGAGGSADSVGQQEEVQLVPGAALVVGRDDS